MTRGETSPSPTASGRQVAPSVATTLGGGLVDAADVDVGAARERNRRRRLVVLAVALGVPAAFLWWRILTGAPFNVLTLPPMPEDPILWVIPLLLIVAIGSFALVPLLSGRSPHMIYRPEQLDVTLDDVIGLEPIVDEAVKSLNTFLGYARFRERLGGTPRRGLLFEGPPGTGKTHLAKALAHHAEVPFLFVSATSFQSMWYGATARKIRSYFRALRRAARREGGAIGFIEEIDAIATTRRGMSATPAPSTGPAGVARSCPSADGVVETLGAAAGVRVERLASESAGGVVNELLVQLQSFDEPPLADKLHNWLVDRLNAFLPAHRQLSRRAAEYTNVLLIAATNRAGDLDPALLRPGRFDRQLTFERPAREDRRELVDYFLDRKAHADELAGDRLRDQLAGQTLGYTPVMIEHLLDEALLVALRNGRDAMIWRDLQEARLSTEVGLKNPVAYTDRERRVVATHEAGHATVAWLAGTRSLEVLSIIKRSGSLGLLAHGDPEEVHTRSRKEMYDLVDIAMGGMAAEEVFFGEAGTGPGGDLATATEIAAQIVGAVGMGASLVSLTAVQSGALADQNLVGRVLSDAAARPEVDRVLAQAKARARALIGANQHLVTALRDALLERDELVGDEITAVLEAAGPPELDDLVVERRGGDRRRTDHLTEADLRLDRYRDD